MIYAHKLPIPIVTLLLAACVTSLAQEHPLPPRHRPPPKERPQGHEGRGDRHQAHDHRGHHDKNRPLDTFMEKIRATDPEEFTRLDTLRTENPKQFHQQLRKRRNHLIGKQFLAKLEEMPRLGEAIHKLTREEKKQVAHGISEFFKHNKIWLKPRGEKYIHTEIKRFERENNNLARTYRQASENEKPAIKNRIRSQLEILYDLQEQERLKQVREAEERIKKLRRLLEEREENRDKVIDRKLLELTDKNPPKW